MFVDYFNNKQLNIPDEKIFTTTIFDFKHFVV